MRSKPGKRQHVSVMLSDVQVAELDAVAARYGISRSDALRMRLRDERTGRGEMFADLPRERMGR